MTDPVAEMIPAVESEMRSLLSGAFLSREAGLAEMLWHHLGWYPDGRPDEPGGKRIRPVLLLLAVEAAGGNWNAALPAAAAVELLHNFSLIHDDVQDRSDTRRGRPTVWVRWGKAQAINAGDAMFTLAHLALPRLAPAYPAELILQVLQTLDETCLRLTGGQYLDLSFERLPAVSLDQYREMIAGKTGALIACSARIGGLLGGADPERLRAWEWFGSLLGEAFQIWDDWLGIWGDSALTGKSSASDLAAGKKTYPVCIGLEKSPRFRSRWQQGPIPAQDVPALAAVLEEDGIKAEVLTRTEQATAEALKALHLAAPEGFARDTLENLSLSLIGRVK